MKRTDNACTEVNCPVCESAAPGYVAIQDRHYFRCLECDLVFLDPRQRLRPSEEAAHYALHQNDPRDASYRAFLSQLAEPMLARLAPASEGLDYGCGPGPALATMLGEAGHRTALYDPFFQKQESALQRSYDFLVCSETVEHFFQPLAEFKRLFSLLRPGGLLGVMTGFVPDTAEAFSCWHYPRDPTHVVFFGPPCFAWIAQRLGMQLELAQANIVLLRRPPDE